MQDLQYPNDPLRATNSLLIQAEDYTGILNRLECRQAKRLLEPANIIYWFKNTRAAARRAEAKSAAAARLPLYLDLGHQLDYLFRLVVRGQKPTKVWYHKGECILYSTVH